MLIKDYFNKFGMRIYEMFNGESSMKMSGILFKPQTVVEFRWPWAKWNG